MASTVMMAVAVAVLTFIVFTGQLTTEEWEVLEQNVCPTLLLCAIILTLLTMSGSAS